MGIRVLPRLRAKVSGMARNTPNDGSRTLSESILVPEVQYALRHWLKATDPEPQVLFGRLAYSFHARPQATDNIDMLVLMAKDVPSAAAGFERIARRIFRHRETHAPVNVFVAREIGLPVALARRIVATAALEEGIKVASAAGLIAAKLGRLSAKDKADIVGLINAARVSLDDLRGFGLTLKQRQAFGRLAKQAVKEAEELARFLARDGRITRRRRARAR